MLDLAFLDEVTDGSCHVFHRNARVDTVLVEENATPAQIALAWLLAQKPWIAPIPGTTKLHRLEENIGGATVELTTDDLKELADVMAKVPVKGERYNAPVRRPAKRLRDQCPGCHGQSRWKTGEFAPRNLACAPAAPGPLQGLAS